MSSKSRPGSRVPQVDNVAKEEAIVISMLSRIAMPLILMFGFYIQFHGEVSPGGGFQSGIVFAIAFILPDLLSLVVSDDISHNVRRRFVPNSIARSFAALGVLIYASIGLFCAFAGYGLFDYGALAQNPRVGGSIGLAIIEVGVSSTIFGSITLIYNSLVPRFLSASGNKDADIER